MRAEQRESGSPGTKNVEVIPEPSTRGSGITRGAVRAEERASGSLGTKNIEVIPEPSTRTSMATREEVRAQERVSGSSGTGNTEVPVRIKQKRAIPALPGRDLRDPEAFFWGNRLASFTLNLFAKQPIQVGTSAKPAPE